MLVLLQVLAQQVLAIVIAVWGSHHGVYVIAGRLALRIQFGCPYRELVIELDQDYRAVDELFRIQQVQESGGGFNNRCG